LFIINVKYSVIHRFKGRKRTKKGNKEKFETTEKPKRSKAKYIAGVIIVAIVGRFCIIGYHLATRQPHIELLNASGELTDSKIKTTATLQNSGAANGIATIRHKTYCSGTTFETQRKGSSHSNSMEHVNPQAPTFSEVHRSFFAEL
jgi:hypothetical protein